MAEVVNNLIELDMLAMIIEEKMGDKIKLYPLAEVKGMDAKAGATINVPTTEYIGDAEDVARLGSIALENITQELKPYTVKKAGKGVTFAQEDINNAYIDIQAEAEKQLLKAIANKVEAEMFDVAMAGALTATIDALNVNGLAKAVVPFGEDLEDAMYLFVNPADLAELRQDKDFVINANHGGKIIGSAGMIFGMEVIVTNRVAQGKALIIKDGALKMFVKKGVEVEMAKDIVTQAYNVVATQHYVVCLADNTKAIAVTIGAGA